MEAKAAAISEVGRPNLGYGTSWERDDQTKPYGGSVAVRVWTGPENTGFPKDPSSKSAHGPEN